MLVQFRRTSLIVATLSWCLLGGSAVQAADSSPSPEPPSPAASEEASLAPGVDVVAVGAGGVLVGQAGQRSDVALDDTERTAAAAALDGASVGIVLVAPPGTGFSKDDPAVVGAKAALERLGAKAVSCEQWSTRRRFQCFGRRGAVPVDALIVFDYFTKTPLEVPGRLLGRGLAVALVGLPGGSAPTDGTVWLRQDPSLYGIEQGRAAGAWAASEWPDTDITVDIRPASREVPDPFYEAVAAGVIESLPGATVLPPSELPIIGTPANLYTGNMRIEDVPLAELAAGTFGSSGEPLAFFPIACPDPLPTMAEFAGCLRLGWDDVGAAAVDAIATLRAGGQVPAEIVANPTVEVVVAEAPTE
jgi:hypothetical protein